MRPIRIDLTPDEAALLSEALDIAMTYDERGNPNYDRLRELKHRLDRVQPWACPRCGTVGGGCEECAATPPGEG